MEKISQAFLDGRPAGGLTRDSIVDNTTLYWLTFGRVVGKPPLRPDDRPYKQG